MRNSVFYESTGILRIDVNFHKRSHTLDHLHLNTIVYDATIDSVHLHVKFDNIPFATAWTEQRYPSS